MIRIQCLALSLLVAALLQGQTASITGRITDTTGAVIPTAEVVVESVETRVKTSVVTNEDGYYTAPLLPPGSYNLQASKAGIKQVRQANLTLRVQQVARVDIVLEVGTLSESVEVSARAVQLDSETSTLGGVVQGRQVAELPLLGRNPYALAMLVTGVRPAAGVNDVPVNQINTAMTTSTCWMARPTAHRLRTSPSSSPALTPYRNSRSRPTPSAPSTGARPVASSTWLPNQQPTMCTSAYDFLRNDAVNANNWFADRSGQKPAPFRLNQFGGAFGAPVIIPKLYDGTNRTFFFGSIELVRLVQGVTFSNTVPKPEQSAAGFQHDLQQRQGPDPDLRPAQHPLGGGYPESVAAWMNGSTKLLFWLDPASPEHGLGVSEGMGALRKSVLSLTLRLIRSTKSLRRAKL